MDRPNVVDGVNDARTSGRLPRRTLLSTGLALPVCGTFRARVSASEATRHLRLHCPATDEYLQATYWNASGGYIPSALRDFSWFLRDWRTGDTTPIDPELLDTVHALKTLLEYDAHVTVHSGFRSEMTNQRLIRAGVPAARRSQHLLGTAMDLSLFGATFSKLATAARKVARGGLGLYPNRGSIHLDTGPRREWSG